MKKQYFSLFIVMGFLMTAPLLYANRAHRSSSRYGSDGSLSVERFSDPPIKYPNAVITQTRQVCSSNEHGSDKCGFEHTFIYQFQLGASDLGTITSFTITVTGQNGGIFSNSPTYGILTCNPQDQMPPVPCSPFGAALTNCTDADSFAVNESGMGTSTYSQTWNFASCPAFVAGESLAIFMDLCSSADDDNCPADGTPVIDPTNGPPVVTISVSRAAQFIPVAPCRIADTRGPNGELGGPALQAGVPRDFPIPQSSCGIPTNASAYSFNVTVVPNGPLGYLTVWPTGQNQPVVSTLNSIDGRVKANAAIVPGGNNGSVTVYATNSTDLVVDIDGYFAPVSDSTLAFYTVSPCRIADTRNAPGDLGGPYLKGGVERDFPVLEASSCNIPMSANVVAYSLNFTAVPHEPLGYMTVWATGQTKPPLASTLNAPTGTVTANAAIVQAGDDEQGSVSVYATNDTDLVIDINGYFALANDGDDGLSLYTAMPCRVLDTRLAGGGFNGQLNPPVNVLGSSCGVPTTAQAYVFNATAVPAGRLGFLTLWPDSWVLSQPLASTLNAFDGAVTSNMAIVGAGAAGEVNAYANGVTNLILDISSYFAP